MALLWTIAITMQQLVLILTQEFLKGKEYSILR